MEALVKALRDFAYDLGDFLEKVEKGLAPDVTPIRAKFGKLLDVVLNNETA